MPVEKLRELEEPVNGNENGHGPVDGQQKGKETNGSPNTKNGILHKSGSKLGFNKKKSINEMNGHHGTNGHGKRIDDPFRFIGDGMDFKAKLIGIRDVTDARGDQMCQDAIQLCKALVKSSGQHKQRILFNISVEGLKIKELSNGHVFHTFPVNKVSFIAKDVTDNRAFGFVYGSPEEKHKFYAIKTEKTSDQVVISIRDMFHVVYEMKKKQMDEAKQGNDSKGGQDSKEENGVNGHSHGSVSKEDNGVAVADLLDLETELQNLKQGVQDINTAWEDFNPRAGETTGLSVSLSTASFGNGYHNHPQHPFYQAHQHSNTASAPDFFSLGGDTPSSLNETRSSINSGNEDPFGGNAFQPAAPISDTNNMQQFGQMSTVFAAVPPPPPSANRRRTTSTNSSNLINGDHSNNNGQVPPVFLIDKHSSSSSMVGSGTGPFDSPAFGEDPFDTSHVNRLVNGAGFTPHYSHHAASTPIPRFSSTSSPPFGQSGVSLDMSQPPSAIMGTRSSASDVSSSNSGIVFGTTATNNKMFLSSNGTHESQTGTNSILNQAMYGSNSATGLLESGLADPVTPEKEFPPLAFESTPLAGENGYTLNTPPVSGSPIPVQMANGASPSQSLLNANVLKAPNATSIDQAFDVLCNLDALIITPVQQQQQQPNSAIGTNGHKEDLFAQMRPPPKKSINELRGSPPTSTSPSNTTTNPIPFASLDNLYSSSPKTPISGTSPALAPPIPPRSNSNGLLPPLSNGSEHNRHNRRLPQPILNNCKGGGFVDKQHDPFADDPFFAS